MWAGYALAAELDHLGFSDPVILFTVGRSTRGRATLPTRASLRISSAKRIALSRPLYEAKIALAQRAAGATVIKGFMGFGAHSRIHTAKLLELSQDLPIVVEIVDAPDKIEAFMPDLEKMVGDGLITLERAEVLLYRPGRAGP
jgi:PII-like signaling protein